MRENEIENLEDFYDKIVEMNKGFYTLQKEVKATQTALDQLDPESKTYPKQRKRLEFEIALCQWKMKDFQKELGRAEKIKKALEQVASVPSPEMEKSGDQSDKVGIVVGDVL